MADTKYITLSNLSDFKNQADSLYTTQSELTTAISAAKITIEVNPSTTTDSLSAIGLGGTNYSVYPKDYVSTTALTNTLLNYALSDTVTSISAAVTSLTNSYTSLSSAITSVTTSVNTLSGSLASLTNSVNTLSNTVAGHTTSIFGLSTSISTLVTSVTTLSNDVATLSAMISGGSVSGSYLPLSGGTLTGDLTIASDTSNSNSSHQITFSSGSTTSGTLGTVSLYIVDNDFWFSLEDTDGGLAEYCLTFGSSGRLVAEYDLKSYLPLSGGTLTSAITLSQNSVATDESNYIIFSCGEANAIYSCATYLAGDLGGLVLNFTTDIGSINAAFMFDPFTTYSGTASYQNSQRVAKYSDIYYAVSDLSASISNISNSYTSLSTALTSATNSISSLSTSVDNLSNSVTTLSSAIETVSTTYLKKAAISLAVDETTSTITLTINEDA